MFIKFFDNFIIKVIGKPGKKLLMSMFLEYYDAKILEDIKELTPSLVIFLGKDQTSIVNYKNSPFLIGILSKKDYDFISSFCKDNNLRLYIAPTKKIFSYYKHLKLPLFDYIHLSLAASVSSLSKEILDKDSTDSFLSVVNINKELVSIDVHKPFHIRSKQIKKEDDKGLQYTIDIFWEPGKNMLGNKLLMEWLRNEKISNTTNSLDVYTIIDIDQIYETNDMKDYLLPFTTLGIYQKGILIVNSELEDSDLEDSTPFDYHVYTNIMEIWNSKHYIPKRLSLLETQTLTNELSGSKVPNLFNPDFELSSKKPPIFILDTFESIYNFISKIHKNSIILYIGNEENYKIIQNL
jgi:hypothetical protein